MSSSDNIKVAIKVRPLIQRERDQKLQAQWRIQGDTIECSNPVNPNVKFSFDQICDEKTNTEDLFEKVTRPIVESSVNGFNGTIFAYGQTSSGKTHTMLGTPDQPGITVLAVRNIFKNMNENSDRSYLLRVSYIEIYNERVYDLLDKRNELKIQETGTGETTVKSVEKIVNSEQSIVELLSQGNKERKVAETKMNVQSSRSHTIFSIIIESQDRSGVDESDAAVQISILNLVDLAGSERADATGATGSRLKEGAHINKSLLSLSLVINKLSEDPEQSKHINYRDSKLTRILQPSLGGNALTAIICTITPAAFEETYYTLGFANRAKTIKNKPIVNEVLSDAVMLKRMHKQIAGLEKQLTDEREKCKKIETNLSKHRVQIIGGRRRPSGNRRRTWAPTVGQAEKIDERPAASTADYVPLGSSVFGHQIEYTEEQFHSILDSSFSSVCPPSMYNTNTPIGRTLASRAKSMLKTPKSFLKRPSLIGATAAASPVNTYDKDKRLETLEIEYEELQQFQKLESEDFNAKLAEKTSQIDMLTQQIHELDRLRQQNESEIKSLQADLLNAKNSELAKSEKLEAELKESREYRTATEQRMKKIEAEKSEAAKAKTLAECNYSSIEFEYEQYKIISKARERELVAQIDEKTYENQIKLLNAKITELSNSRNQLEVSVWDSGSKLKTAIIQSNEKDKEIERLTEENSTLKSQIFDNQKYACIAAELKKLQSEYDELSNQLMDRIQGNDDAVKQHAAIVADLTKLIDALKSNLEEEKTRAEMLSNELSTLRNDLRYSSEQLEKANGNLESEREQLTREIVSLKASLHRSEDQLKNYQSEASAEKTASTDRLHAAVADANTAVALEKERSEQLQKEVESLKLALDEVKIELENNKQVETRDSDAETSKMIAVVCILLKNTIDECNRFKVELNDLHGRLKQLTVEYTESMGREKELSNVHTNAVNEHAIIVANYEGMLIQLSRDHSVAISSLKMEIGELSKKLIVESKGQRSMQTQTEQCRCEEVEREKGMLEEICNKSRITVQFAVNELAILRHSYAELEMSFAKQELDNLKLQKTISENDGDFVEESSMFASTMASTTTIANDTLLADCSVVQRDDEKPDTKGRELHQSSGNDWQRPNECSSDAIDDNEMTIANHTIKVESSMTERNDEEHAVLTATLNANMREVREAHEKDRRRLEECLSDASPVGDFEQLLTMVKQHKEKAAEYDRLLHIMITANATFSQYENIENAIIESQQKHLETSEQLLLMSNNYETLKEKFNVLQGECDSVRNENDAMKGSLSNNEEKMASIEIDINRQLSANEKLREKVALERENELKLREQIELLGTQLHKLKATQEGLAEENKSLSDQVIAKAAEIERLQRIVEEKMSVEQELAKVEELRREIEQISNQLSLKEFEITALSAEKLAVTAQLDDKNSQIELLGTQLHKLEATRGGLAEENKSLSDQVIEKTAEVERLQQTIEKKMSVEQELAKSEELRREIDQVRNQLSLKEFEVTALNAEKLAVTAQLDDKNSQIERFEADRTKLAAARETIDTLTGELKELKKDKNALEAEQIRQRTEFDKLLARLQHSNEEITNMINEKQELNAQKTEMERKMNEWIRSKDDEVSEMLKMIECLTQTNHNLEAKIENLKSELADSLAQLGTDEEKMRQMAEDHSNHLKEMTENDQKFHSAIDQLKTKISVFEDEQEVLERENKTLATTIGTQQNQIVQLQSKMNGINDELMAIKQELAAKVAECKVLESECGEAERLRATIETMKLKVQSANDKQAEIEHKSSQFTATIKKQSKDIDQMQKAFAEKENQAKLSADKALQSVRQELNEKCAEHRALTEKFSNMEKLYNESVARQPKQSASHAKRCPGDGEASNKDHNTTAEFDKLLRENHSLKTSHQRLIDELDDLRTTARQTRKTKRHSTHDDTRRISGFDSNLIDVHVQTDPVNELCRCIEFDARIAQLKRDIIIKDAKFNTFKMHTGIDALKRENEELQSTLSALRTEFGTYRIEHERVTLKYERAKRKLGEYHGAEMTKALSSNSSTQTDAEDGEMTVGGSYVSQMNAYKLMEKYQACKKMYLQMKEAYEKLQSEQFQSNESTEMVKRKYEQLKTLCMHRKTEIDRLEEVEIGLTKQLETIQLKYNSAKMVIIHRGKEIERLSKMCSIADENMPANGNCSKAYSDTNGKR